MKIFRNILTLLFLSNIIFARPIVIKLATVAPEGTEYYNLLFEMGQRWQQETRGQIQLRIYPNGVVGGERDTIRKMRVGQIQASAMSSIGLAELTDQIQAFTLPMGFQNYEEIDKVKSVMFDDISEGLSQSGFNLLFLVDIGWVYWFSAEEISVPKDLMDAKIYTTAGDYMSDIEKKNMGDETWQTNANKAVPRYYSPVELLSMRVDRLELDLKTLKKKLTHE